MQPDKKNALGRGLSSLISDIPPIDLGRNDNTTHAEEQSGKVDLFIELDLIETNPYQPRTVFKAEDLEELSNSIKQVGVIQPILVRKSGEKFHLIAGERRFQASKLAGLKTIPALVKDYSDLEVFEVALIENIQRENLNPVEEAVAYKRLMQEFNLNQNAIADKVGKSRSHVANLLRLLELPEEVKNMLSDGKITTGHARSLIGKDNALELAHQIVEQKLSVRDAEKLNRKEPKSIKDTESNQANSNSEEFKDDADLMEIERSVSEHLGMRVQIRDGHSTGGTLAVNFETLAQLDLLIQLLTNNKLNF